MLEHIRKRVRKLLGRDKPVYDFDEYMVTVAMYAHLILQTDTSREALADIARTQFGHIDFSPYANAADMCEALGPEYSIGFKILATLAYVLLNTALTREEIEAEFRNAFSSAHAQALPEVIEAERRMRSCVPMTIPLCELQHEPSAAQQ
jgi:hypothetical protein